MGKKAERVDHVCEQCGKVVKRTPREAEKRRFCSHPCFWKWRSENLRGPLAKGWRGGRKIKRICQYCGEEFEIFRNLVEQWGWGIYCSAECRVKGQEKKAEHECLYCHKKFEAWPSRGNMKFCSNECRYKQWKGSNSPHYTGGVVRVGYGKKFNERLRERIRKRDRYRCVVCGKAERSRKICIHHIDYDRFNNNPLNLVTLCFHHHGKTTKKSERDWWYFLLSNLVRSAYGDPTI